MFSVGVRIGGEPSRWARRAPTTEEGAEQCVVRNAVGVTAVLVHCRYQSLEGHCAGLLELTVPGFRSDEGRSRCNEELLCLRSISIVFPFRYSSAVDLLVDVNIHFAPGWTALVGANGSGKTSLLRLVAGEVEPSAGSVVLDPAGAVVAYCEQESEQLTAGVVALGEAWDGPVVTLRGRLRLVPEDLGRWATLSPGERKRWQIGAALASDPDMLLLDEPTNHLDAEGRTWLLDALRRFTRSGVGRIARPYGPRVAHHPNPSRR